MSLTIQKAIDTIVTSIPGAPFPDTVDVIKLGDAQQNLTGIVVTFLASCDVIEQAIQSGANLIITHEPTFYNHRDSTNWLSHHPTYVAKRRLVEENRLVIWRFHDYLHSLPPDNTVMGLVQALNWESSQSSEQPYICHVQPTTLLELGQLIKKRLSLPTIRMVGNIAMTCERVGVLPGFPPAEFQIGSLGETNIDVLVTGEIHEWEVSEYVRDANHLGYPKGLIVIGHAASEEPGMRRIIPWLEKRLPAVTIRFVPTVSPFNQL